MTDTFRPLRLELDRWRAAGRTAAFWLRDDDAVVPTPALDRLLDLTDRYGVPAALAAIPAHTGGVLADRLAGAAKVTVLVHGWSHENHAPIGQKKQELGIHRPTEVVLAELRAGLAKLAGLYPETFCPVLVPPWNRIHRDVESRLADAGYAALSVFGPADPAALPQINTTVDIIDWRGTRRCRDQAALVRDIVAQLNWAFVQADEPVGLLTHHLVHDPDAWRFLEALFEVTAGDDACRWAGIADLLTPMARATQGQP